MTSSNESITIALKPNPGVLLNYSDNERYFRVTDAFLREYWEYDSAEDIEYINAYVQGEYLLCNLWTASGQNGMVVVLDRINVSFIHVSEGAFAVRSLVYVGSVISLCDVSQWGVSPHLALTWSPLGTTDALTEAQPIPCDEISSIELKDRDKLFMSIRPGILTYGYDDKTASVDIDAFLKTTDMGGAQ